MSAPHARRKRSGHRSTPRKFSGARNYGTVSTLVPWGKAAKHWLRALRAPRITDWLESL